MRFPAHLLLTLTCFSLFGGVSSAAAFLGQDGKAGLVQDRKAGTRESPGGARTVQSGRPQVQMRVAGRQLPVAENGRAVRIGAAFENTSSTAGTGASTSLSAASVTAAGPHVGAAGTPYCPDSIRDQAAPLNCLNASSVPVTGMLYPLGPEFNIDAAGQVGVGTLAPTRTLDVAGDVRVQGRAAFGNDPSLADNRTFEMSHRITDFSSSNLNFPFQSSFVIDPPFPLTGLDETWIFSHLFYVESPAGNPYDIQYIQGPWMGATHKGDGDMQIVDGTLSYAGTKGAGTTTWQLGACIIAEMNGPGTVENNYYLELRGGNYTAEGYIENNHGLYLVSPFPDGPLGNHYGIYLEDQDFGLNDSYAIYSAGGTCAFQGDVGIGTLNPATKLQVGEAGDGSEARANAWNLLSSRAYKRDIKSLDASQCADILDKIKALDVVYYTYMNDADEREHLGVIAEDSPAEILGKDGRSISLGDYASFLLAGIKAQQYEIDELRFAHARDLTELKGELAELRRMFESGR